MSAPTLETMIMAVAQATGMKPRLVIERCSCTCGGNWAWVFKRPERADIMLGCVCHHWWTLALRAVAE